MTHRHPHENRYCGTCKATVKHEVKGDTFTCLRCGSAKHPVIRTRPAAPAPDYFDELYERREATARAYAAPDRL